MSLPAMKSSTSRLIAEQMERSSWIRQMFEIGIQLRQERGPENVFDFSLGNPEVEPPAAVLDALRQVVAENRPHGHGYMPNAGFPEVRAVMARRLAERTGIPFRGEDILMTVGAAGAINTVLKAVLDPGDEAIVLNPYFPEYRFYIENHGGCVIPVETDEHFQPDIAAIAAAITRGSHRPDSFSSVTAFCSRWRRRVISRSRQAAITPSMAAWIGDFASRLGGGPEMIASSSCRPSPVNARRPPAISYNTAPYAKMSVRQSIGSPRTCSGERYAASAAPPAAGGVKIEIPFAVIAIVLGAIAPWTMPRICA